MNSFLWSFVAPTAAAIALGGCATDIMRGYVGRTPEAVMARYGPPDHIFDLPEGRRAYQWLQISQSTSSGSETTRTRWATKDGKGRPRRVTTTQISPPVIEERRCFYTMYARRGDTGWVFDGFERPEWGC